MTCLDCGTQAREFPGLVKVTEKDQLYNFCVESTGSLRPELIVQRGVEVLRRKLIDVRTQIQSANQAMVDQSMGGI